MALQAGGGGGGGEFISGFDFKVEYSHLNEFA